MRIAIVASNFNKEVTDGLIDGALNCYKSNFGNELNLNFVYKVPGAFEVPSFVNQLLNNCNIKFDAIITLGCVIKGETAHFEYISESVTKQIMKLSLNKNNIPVLYGILTTYNYQQALDRIKNDNSNKGYEVMSAAIMMVNQFLNFKK